MADASRIAPQQGFCTECGAALTMIPTGKFHGYTGAPITRGVCPTGKCEHTGCSHEFQHFCFGRCTRCGVSYGTAYPND